MTAQRECAARYCDRLLTEQQVRAGGKYCGRRCAFRSLYFSKHQGLWHQANERMDGRYDKTRYARDRE